MAIFHCIQEEGLSAGSFNSYSNNINISCPNLTTFMHSCQGLYLRKQIKGSLGTTMKTLNLESLATQHGYSFIKA